MISLKRVFVNSNGACIVLPPGMQIQVCAGFHLLFRTNPHGNTDRYMGMGFALGAAQAGREVKVK